MKHSSKSEASAPESSRAGKNWMIDDPSEHYISIRQVFFLAIACCLLIANMYGVQPIISDIASNLAIPIKSSGIILTLAQIGYGVGVLFIVPLGDSFENKRLILLLLCCLAIALFMVHLAAGMLVFYAAIFCVGLCSSVVQLIIPFSIGLIRPSQRGRLSSIIVAGAALGMVLGRPIFSFLTGLTGWRGVYLMAAGSVCAIIILFYYSIPAKACFAKKLSYPGIFVSMGKLFVTMPKVRSQVFMLLCNFTGFTLFWASFPIMLASELQFTHNDIAMLSLASLAAPLGVVVAGSMADKGWRLAIIGFGAFLCLLAFLITPLLGLATATMLLAIIFMDSGLNISNVFIQQAVLLENANARSRLNALIISVAFAGGALGSYWGPYIYTNFGWTPTALTGSTLSLISLGAYLHMRSVYKNEKSSI